MRHIFIRGMMSLIWFVAAIVSGKSGKAPIFAEDHSFQYFTFREYLSYVFSVYKKAFLITAFA